MVRIANIIAALVIACALAASAAPVRSDAAVFVGVSVTFGPPAIPVYVQPPAPGPNYIWQPGYWAWGPDGYYWVPGTWVLAPAVGLYWTPGYWGFSDGLYVWNPGYWGPAVGFYGGINYGFGYYGTGYAGGVWSGGAFRYNTAVTNVNVHVVHNVYYNRAVYRGWNDRVSYNGGPHGIAAHASAAQQHAYAQRRFGMTKQQSAHETNARNNVALRYSANHGRPTVAAPHAQTYHAPQHTQTYHAPQHTQTYHAPQHTQTYHAPQHTQTYHAPQHAAYHPPAYHPPAQSRAPQQHAYVRPQPHANAHPQGHPAPHATRRP